MKILHFKALQVRDKSHTNNFSVLRGLSGDVLPQHENISEKVFRIFSTLSVSFIAMPTGKEKKSCLIITTEVSLLLRARSVFLAFFEGAPLN